MTILGIGSAIYKIFMPFADLSTCPAATEVREIVVVYS